MSGVSFQHDLKQKVIIRLPISFSFSGSCRFLSCSFLYNIFLCPLILSNFFCACGLSYEGCRILVPLAVVSAPSWVRLVERLCPYLFDLSFDCCYCDPSLPWTLKQASPWLCGCHCPVCGGVCSLVGGIEPTQICFFAVILICG